MGHRSLCEVVVWLIVLVVLLTTGTAAQTTSRERSSSSQQQVKPQPAQTTVTQAKPVKPVSPIKTDLRIDTRAGDIAVMGAKDLMVLDLQGNGLDLGGRVTIEVGGSERDTNWTRPGTEDAFLAVDARMLRAIGFELSDGQGRAIQSRILVSDGLRLRGPNGGEVEITDAWHLLGQFDTNKDGKIDSRDGVWQSLSLFVDANADGTMSGDELSSISDSAIRELSLVTRPAGTDAHGNTLTEGTFSRADGTAGLVVGVTLRRY